MATSSKWKRITPGCYAEQLPVVQLYSAKWKQPVSVGTYSTNISLGTNADNNEYRIFDGIALRRVLPQPSHWRPLSAAPYSATKIRMPMAAWRAKRYREALAKYTAIEQDRAAGMSWHRIALRHNYRHSACARESHNARSKYIAAERAKLEEVEK